MLWKFEQLWSVLFSIMRKQQATKPRIQNMLQEVETKEKTAYFSTFSMRVPSYLCFQDVIGMYLSLCCWYCAGENQCTWTREVRPLSPSLVPEYTVPGCLEAMVFKVIYGINCSASRSSEQQSKFRWSLCPTRWRISNISSLVKA